MQPDKPFLHYMNRLVHEEMKNDNYSSKSKLIRMRPPVEKSSEWLVTDHAMVKKSDIYSISTYPREEIVFGSSAWNERTCDIQAVLKNGRYAPLVTNIKVSEAASHLNKIAKQMTEV